ncbi:MAG TPA: DUF998 domain-containing protein [Candidatus Limnocylindrales bacterium]|jgi:hypothetical membrane protein
MSVPRPTRAARVARAAALTGALALTVGSVVAALAYGGAASEPYSPLNHWVSELGELGVSSFGWAFNLGLIAGGLGFVVLMAGLAIDATDRLRWVYGPIGVVAGLAGALVGVFPMNNREVHGLVALTFFNLGWIAVATASVPVAVGHDRRFPRVLAGAGAVAVVAFLAFLYEVRVDPVVVDSALGAPVARPAFWLSPALEWAVIVAIIGWTVLAALSWRRTPAGERS